MEWFAYNQNANLAALLAIVYSVAFIAKKDADVTVCSLAFIASNIYCISPLYKYMVESNPSINFLIYASIYFTAIRFLSSYKVIAACFIMALFEGIMYKAYLNELGHKGIENGLYDNYEGIVTLLHVAIIFQMVQWAKLRYGIRFLRDSVLRPFLHARLLLPYRG